MGITRDSVHKRRASSGKQKIWRKKRKFEIGRPPAMTHLGGTRVHQVRCRGGIIKHRALRLETGNFSWASEATTRKTRILNVVYNASNNEFVRMNVLVKGAIVEIDASPFIAWYEKHYGVFIGKKKVAKVAKAAPKNQAKVAEKPGKGAKNAKATKNAKAKKDEKAKKNEATEKKENAAPKDEKAAKTTKAPAAKKSKKSKKGKKEKKPSSHVLRKLAARRRSRKLDSYLADEFQNGRLLARIASRPGQCGRADGYILEGPEYEFYSKKASKKRSK